MSSAIKHYDDVTVYHGLTLNHMQEIAQALEAKDFVKTTTAPHRSLWWH